MYLISYLNPKIFKVDILSICVDLRIDTIGHARESNGSDDKQSNKTLRTRTLKHTDTLKYGNIDTLKYGWLKQHHRESLISCESCCYQVTAVVSRGISARGVCVQICLLKPHSSGGSTQWHQTSVCFFSPRALGETGWGADSDNRPREKHVLPKRRIFKRLELLSRRSDIWSKQLWDSKRTWSAQRWRDKKY